MTSTQNNEGQEPTQEKALDDGRTGFHLAGTSVTLDKSQFGVEMVLAQPLHFSTMLRRALRGRCYSYHAFGEDTEIATIAKFLTETFISRQEAASSQLFKAMELVKQRVGALVVNLQNGQLIDKLMESFPAQAQARPIRTQAVYTDMLQILNRGASFEEQILLSLLMRETFSGTSWVQPLRDPISVIEVHQDGAVSGGDVVTALTAYQVENMLNSLSFVKVQSPGEIYVAELQSLLRQNAYELATAFARLLAQLDREVALLRNCAVLLQGFGLTTVSHADILRTTQLWSLITTNVSLVRLLMAEQDLNPAQFDSYLIKATADSIVERIKSAKQIELVDIGAATSHLRVQRTLNAHGRISHVEVLKQEELQFDPVALISANLNPSIASGVVDVFATEAIRTLELSRIARDLGAVVDRGRAAYVDLAAGHVTTTDKTTVVTDVYNDDEIVALLASHGVETSIGRKKGEQVACCVYRIQSSLRLAILPDHVEYQSDTPICLLPFVEATDALTRVELQGVPKAVESADVTFILRNDVYNNALVTFDDKTFRHSFHGANGKNTLCVFTRDVSNLLFGATYAMSSTFVAPLARDYFSRELGNVIALVKLLKAEGDVGKVSATQLLSNALSIFTEHGRIGQLVENVARDVLAQTALDASQQRELYYRILRGSERHALAIRLGLFILVSLNLISEEERKTLLALASEYKIAAHITTFGRSFNA